MDVKQIQVRAIMPAVANSFIKRWHYSGKVVNNSQLHFGAFVGQRLTGVLSFGPSLDKRKVGGLVAETGWNEFVELNRMAFHDDLPKNSESRVIAVCLRLLKKHAPHIKWVVSFADGTQCGDGTIYRATGFLLTGIKKNTQIWEAPSGESFSRMSLTDGRSKQQQQQARQVISRVSVTKGAHVLETGGASMNAYVAAGWEPKPGFQLRYIYFIDKSMRDKLTMPVLPYSKITELGAGMYKGVMRQKPSSEAATFQVAEGGAEPTLTHQGMINGKK